MGTTIRRRYDNEARIEAESAENWARHIERNQMVASLHAPHPAAHGAPRAEDAAVAALIPIGRCVVCRRTRIVETAPDRARGSNGDRLAAPTGAPWSSGVSGGIRNSWGWGGTAPFGHLEFDADELSIFGVGMRLDVRRSEARFITLSTGLLAVRVTVVGLDGNERYPYFAALGRDAVRAALQARGWPVLDYRFIRRSPRE